jgi:hypothetical protein
MRKWQQMRKRVHTRNSKELTPLMLAASGITASQAMFTHLLKKHVQVSSREPSALCLLRHSRVSVVS